MEAEREEPTLRQRIGDLIFQTDTPASRAFDIVLLWLILLSLAAVIVESVPRFRAIYGQELRVAEWMFTILFTVEYILRVYSARNRRHYIFSFYGIVDLLAFLPSYLSLIVPGARYTLVLRALRLLRVFRVLKLVHFLDDADLLIRALKASREKVLVFLFAVATLVLVAGAAIYILEGPDNGFTSIPVGVYWAVVTLTTVGYGDYVPQSTAGRFISSVLMITGYAIIAVPTGIVTTEIGRAGKANDAADSKVCPRCGAIGHKPNANYCWSCGERLPHE